MTLRFQDVPVVDNHCHALVEGLSSGELSAWREFFTESRERTMFEHVAAMASYRRIVLSLADFFGCEAEEVAVLEARRRLGDDKVMAALLTQANIDTLIIDRGFPSSDQVIPDAHVKALVDVRLESLLRLEPVMEELIAGNESLDDVKSALRERLTDLRAGGYVGLKSIAAYRTGLDIDSVEAEDAEDAFRDARDELDSRGSYRLEDKPLLDALLAVAFQSADEQGLPLQFHVGYGDSDVDLARSNPLELRPLLESHRYDGMRVVLLHECYPYTREGAYLAAIYGNVYLDLSYGIPFLGFSEMLACTRAAVAVAPTSKLVYSSDGLGVPELHWSSAARGRRALELVLGECVSEAELTEAQAFEAGADILRNNAYRLYGLE
jgi:predicted TIM-barrel fold metal-dependent hydrolase